MRGWGGLGRCATNRVSTPWLPRHTMEVARQVGHRHLDLTSIWRPLLASPAQALWYWVVVVEAHPKDEHLMTSSPCVNARPHGHSGVDTLAGLRTKLPEKLSLPCSGALLVKHTKACSL